MSTPSTTTTPKEQLQAALTKLLRYRVTLFVLLLFVLYAFLAYRINTFYHVAPSTDTAGQTARTALPRIDPATVHKIQQLKDNSVNVQTLFNEARDNPFQE